MAECVASTTLAATSVKIPEERGLVIIETVDIEIDGLVLPVVEVCCVVRSVISIVVEEVEAFV